MSYLLETLGRGLLIELFAAFENQLPGLGDDAPEELEVRARQSPTSTDLALRLGVSFLRRHELAQAKAAFEHAMDLGRPSPQPAIGLACVYDELGRLDLALKYLSIGQAHDPQDPAIVFAIGFCHERNENAAAAIVSYQQALEICPGLRNARERLAALAVREGDWQTAIDAYQQLAELEPGDINVLLTLANLHLQAKRPADASDRFQQALMVEPDFAEDGPPDVTDTATRQDLQNARQTLEQLVAKYPGAAAFHIHLADVYVKLGEDRKAVRQYSCALEAQPDLLEATVKLGTQHLRQGRYVDAARTFNQAVELNDRLMLAFVGLGVSQEAAGNRHEALASFDLASSLEPSSVLLFAEAARLHLCSEQRQTAARGPAGRASFNEPEDDAPLREALRRHRRALMNAPHHADLHYRHGLLLRQVGEHTEAIAAFRRAVAINPHYAKALIKLGICLKEAGEVDEAIEVFQRALRLDDRFVDVHYQLGLLFAQRSRFELAVEEFEQAMRCNGQNIAVRANLALALQNIGMLDRAAATWDSIRELTRQTWRASDRQRWSTRMRSTEG